MSVVGIICDLSYSRHRQFRNYYHALEELYGGVRLITDTFGLRGLDILFIGDDHFYNHRPIFTAPGFIEACNDRDIKVVVFTSEKMFGSKFPWNVDNYNFLQKVDNLYHFAYDVDDCEKVGLKLHRLAMSKYYKDIISDTSKKNKMVFIGRTDCDRNSYDERIQTLNKARVLVPIDIMLPDVERWEDYMKEIAQYRFVFSPLGNGNALVTRFYEILLIHSIPVQQVKPNTLKWYDIEAKFTDCIFFEQPEELPEKLKNFELQKSTSELWLEDYLQKILGEAGLL